MASTAAAPAALPVSSGIRVALETRIAAPINSMIPASSNSSNSGLLPNTAASVKGSIVVNGTPYLSQANGVPEAKRVACKPEAYVGGLCRRYMVDRCMPRAEALTCAYRKAHAKGWCLYQGEAGRCHSIVSAVLSAPAKLMLWLADKAQLTVSRALHVTDDCVVAPFRCAAGMILPRCGTYRVACRTANDGCEDMCLGRYELPSKCVANRWYPMSVPLYREKHVKSCCAHELPVASLVLKCKRNADNMESMEIRDARIIAHLRPDARTLLDPDNGLRCSPHDRQVLEYEPQPACIGFADEEDRLRSEPNQRLEIVNEAIKAVMATHAADGHKYRCVGHIGRTSVCNQGNDSASSVYRISSVTETILNIAVLRQVTMSLPKDVPVVELHDPNLTLELLELSGAKNIKVALQKSFRYTGDGRVPTLHQLMNHCSSLPEFASAEIENLQALLVNRLSGAGSCDGTERELRFAEVLGKVRPNAVPGTNHQISYLNNIILRHMLPCWRSDDNKTIKEVCFHLGMPSANMCFNLLGKHECSSAASQSCSIDDGINACSHATAHLFSHSTGLSVRAQELAAFLAASSHDCKHSWEADSPSGEYSFVRSMVVPAVSVQRKAGVSFGYGWHHVGLLKGTRSFGEHGLRAMIRIGEALGGNTVIACRVPACSLSFALCTTASVAALSGCRDLECNKSCLATGDPMSGISVTGILEKIVGSILKHMAGAGSINLDRATFWNPTLNAQMACMPAPQPNFGHHVRYCRDKMSLFAGVVPELSAFIEAGEFISAAEGVGTTGCTLRVELSPVKVPGNSERQLASYALVMRTPLGELVSYPLAYDKDACRTNYDAEVAARNPNQGRGAFRVLCRNTGTLSDYVELGNVRVGEGERAFSSPAVSLNGRIFITKRAYESLRRSWAPDTDEQLKDRIARSEEVDSAIGDSSKLSSIGNLVDELHGLKNVEAALPDTANVALGRRGGGGGFYRGGGAGFGAGLALGALGTGALYAATAPYAVAPPVVVDPLYANPLLYPRYRPYPYRRYWY